MDLSSDISRAKAVHKESWNKAKAKAPILQVNTLLTVGYSLLTKSKTIEEVLNEYGPEIKEAAVAYAECFSDNFIAVELHEYLGETGDAFMERLREEDFSKKLLAAASGTGSVILSFCKGKINATEMMSQLGKCGAKEVGASLMKAGGLDLEAGKALINQVGLTAASTVAFVALTEAYKIMMKEMTEANLKHEEMLLVKAECDESIAMIQQYRQQMEAQVARYFGAHYEVIESGFAAMDRAIAEGDADGYIRGNCELQKLFGFDSQFTNQEEFDDLMLSDLDFKL